MKISRLEIKDYNQFKDLQIDLTYPAGHDKEGLPLEKVCITGQSGTGKTTILKLLYENTMPKNGQFPAFANDLADRFYLNYLFSNFETRGSAAGWEYVKYKGKLISKKTSGHKDYQKMLFEFINNPKPFLLYFPDGLIHANVAPLNTNVQQRKKIFNFNEDLNLIWAMLFADIQKYQERTLVLVQKVANLVMEGSKDKAGLKALINELSAEGQKQNNPLKRFAEDCADQLLGHFNLKVKTDLDIRSKEDIGKIKIVDNRGQEIPLTDLSTGTKQVLFSVLPLYTLQLNQAIILYDEPETSLFPDMQKIIVDYYKSFSADSQFFFATHSSIIASGFDPWEIVELQFNNDGYVEQKQYFDGERHVDNYMLP